MGKRLQESFPDFFGRKGLVLLRRKPSQDGLEDRKREDSLPDQLFSAVDIFLQNIPAEIGQSDIPPGSLDKSQRLRRANKLQFFSQFQMQVDAELVEVSPPLRLPPTPSTTP